MEGHFFSKYPETENKFYILGDERVFHSKAPELFTTIMKRIGLKGTYEPFVVKSGNIEEAVREIRLSNATGANIATPYKEAIIPYLDELSEGAQIIGSVNTIVRMGDQLKGYNTNAIGFMDALKEAGFNASDKPVLVFGTGGAARAVVFILKWIHATPIFITGRSPEKIMPIVNQIGGEAVILNDLVNRPLSVNLVINATSVSSLDESPELAGWVSRLQLSDCELVMDMNYGRSQNFWQNMAENMGIRFIDGLSALSNQARRSFALWTGIDIMPEWIMTALKESKPVV